MTADTLAIAHTDRDHQALVDAGVNPDSTQPRERAVPCTVCGTPTRHQNAGCDDHYRPPARAVEADGLRRIIERRRRYAARIDAYLAAHSGMDADDYQAIGFARTVMTDEADEWQRRLDEITS